MTPTPDLKGAWKAKVITLFPNCFPGVLGESLTGKALQEGLWQLEPIDLRPFGEGKHRNVDDTPAGGGAGMVLRADVLVVGGGFTGLWAAMQAKERKLDVDIIIIEQTFVADGASGRNGGFLNASIAHGETNIEAQFPGEADELEELGKQNIKELLETLEKYNIDARYENAGMTSVALDEESAVRLYEEYQDIACMLHSQGHYANILQHRLSKSCSKYPANYSTAYLYQVSAFLSTLYQYF